MERDRRYKILGVLVLSTSILTLFIIIHAIQDLTRKDIELARRNIEEQAIALYNNIVTIRSWAASHGGVFVRQKKGMKPNPYLEKGYEKTAAGETLILMNPAWMTREIFEYLRENNKAEKHHYKITSPDPVNPLNAPDEFEREAFEYFKRNPDESHYLVYPKENPEYVYFMGLLRTEAPCLACHTDSHVGDIRGGIRISVPISNFREKEKSLRKQSLSLILLISFLVFLTAVLVFYLLRILERRRDELEEGVRERTDRITKMHLKEVHLRKIMQTIANVNKEIINLHSVDTLLVHICDIISYYGENKYSWIFLAGEGKKKARYFTGEGVDPQTRKTIEKNFLDTKAGEALRKRVLGGETVIEKNLDEGNKEVAKLCSTGVKSFGVFPIRIAKAKKSIGGICIFSSSEGGCSEEEKKMFDELSGDLGFAIDSYKKQKDISRLKSERMRNFEETILSLIHLVEERDSYTAGHSVRVAYYCSIIGKEMGLGKRDMARLEKASILHDLGKIATPDTILLRPGKLSKIEYDLVKLHVQSGYEVLKNVKIYKDLAEIIRYHHERHDGTGYPGGVAGDSIPPLSRILSVADAFDAMTTDRVYHVRMNRDEAVEEIRRHKGTQFDPVVADAAIRALGKLELQKIRFWLPQTELEQKRFAFFFNDRLTDLYNEDYFFILIQDSEKLKKYSTISFISLKNFSQYNKSAGWDQGDEMLRRFSRNLQLLLPDSMLFRVQGDDFIALTKSDEGRIKKELNSVDYLEVAGLSLEVRCLPIPADQALGIDKRSLSQMFTL